jgi:hypothetical protein
LAARIKFADAQERAKNLITQSYTIYEAQQSRKKIAEAQTELALIYWRTGENKEARDCLKGSPRAAEYK